MSTERLPAISNSGDARIVIKRTPNGPNGERSEPSYTLDNGARLLPTDEPGVLKAIDGGLSVRLVSR